MAKQGGNLLVFGPIEIRDTDVHDLPDLDGDDFGDAQDPVDMTNERKVTAKLVSTLDAAGTFNLEGTTQDDEDMDEAATDTSTPIQAGDGTTEVEAIFSDVNWSFVKSKIQMDSAPTTGQVKVVIQTGK